MVLPERSYSALIAEAVTAAARQHNLQDIDVEFGDVLTGFYEAATALEQKWNVSVTQVPSSRRPLIIGPGEEQIKFLDSGFALAGLTTLCAIFVYSAIILLLTTIL